jgi:hypothetical protein
MGARCSERTPLRRAPWWMGRRGGPGGGQFGDGHSRQAELTRRIDPFLTCPASAGLFIASQRLRESARRQVASGRMAETAAGTL